MIRKIKIFSIFNICLILLGINILVDSCYAEEAQSTVLKTGISLVEQVPNSFMGTWRVSAKISDSSNYSMFKPVTTDIWNLSREGDVINLCNPFSGAAAQINLAYVSGNLIKFTKTGNYDNKRLTDIVELRLNGDSFTGINTLKLETLSNVDNSVIKTETAIYILKGEKISGTSILEK